MGKGCFQNCHPLLLIDHIIETSYPHTVFDLISVLFAYVILGQKMALISEPPPFFLNLLCTLSASIPGAKRYFRRSLHVRDRL